MEKGDKIWGLLRIGLGLIFLWAFLDKVFGLGFATSAENAWINGGSPTTGYLSFATYGPFSGFYQSLAGIGIVDWLFMIGLLFMGLTLTFGFAIRMGSLAGAVMMFLMWTSTLPPEHHPFLDEHIIYMLVLLSFFFTDIGRACSVNKWWTNLGFVQGKKILE